MDTLMHNKGVFMFEFFPTLCACVCFIPTVLFAFMPSKTESLGEGFTTQCALGSLSCEEILVPPTVTMLGDNLLTIQTLMLRVLSLVIDKV